MALAEKQVSMAERLRIFGGYAGERACVLRSMKVALVVGTVLALINHYGALISGRLGIVELLQILVTYAVPFSVATFGAASQGLREELARRSDSGTVRVLRRMF
jgi:hypothetical protein